jgi:hypothetical protein
MTIADPTPHGTGSAAGPSAPVVELVGRVSTWRMRMAVGGAAPPVASAWLRHRTVGVIGIYDPTAGEPDLSRLPGRTQVFVTGTVRPMTVQMLEGDHHVERADGLRGVTLLVLRIVDVQPWDRATAPAPFPRHAVAIRHARRVHGGMWVAQTETPGMQALVATPPAPEGETRPMAGIVGVTTLLEGQSVMRMLWLEPRGGAHADVSAGHHGWADRE